MSENHILLTNKTHIFTGVGADMRYNKPKHEFPMHNHEFHEIVFISKGNANHYINSKIFPITTGDLYFIRNTDIHTYSDFVGETFEYYTLLFEKSILSEMTSFFGMEELQTELLSRQMPPKVQLSKAESEITLQRFSEIFLLMHSDIAKFKIGSRLLISELFSNYFASEKKDSDTIPLWLEYACKKMSHPKNFINGTERFFELCGRKREHCTRTMKKHMGITPNDYILDLRMKYAASLLSSGDMTVSEVACECGYNSLPHFYTLFRKCYGISPGDYKNKNSKTM